MRTHHLCLIILRQINALFTAIVTFHKTRLINYLIFQSEIFLFFPPTRLKLLRENSNISVIYLKGVWIYF